MNRTFASIMALGAMAALASDDAAASGSKSIVDPKYRGKKNADFITAIIERHATKMKDKVTKTKVEGSDEEVSTTTKVPDGVDVEGLFNLAAVNNIDVAKFREQVDGLGFPGRFRMTVANMLRAAGRNRHGIFEPGAEGEDPIWVEADAEWLANSKPAAPAEPTHNRDGTKIKKVKVAAEKDAEAPAENEAVEA